jgi:hypothetical protein
LVLVGGIVNLRAVAGAEHEQVAKAQVVVKRVQEAAASSLV